MGKSSLNRPAALLAALLSSAAVLPAFAAELTYTMPQAVAFALANNGELKSAREEKGIRDAGKVRSGLLPNPALDLEAASGALSGSSNDNSLAVGLSQEFLLADKRGKRLASAEQELQVYRWQLADRERLLGAEVKQTFAAALLARERLALADRSIALNRQLLDVAKERLAAGDIPELELNLVKVELARSEGTRIESARAMLQSRARLWTLLGLASGSRPDLAGNLAGDIVMAKPLAELQQSALANRPDLKALGAEKSRGEADIQLARAESVPNLTAGLVLRRDTTSMEIGGAIGKDTAYTIGVKLSMPIPVFDRNQAAIQEASAKRNSSESRLVAAVSGVEREVETAYATLQNAAAVLALYRADIIPQLEENLKLTQEAWRLGEVGVLAVIQEQKKFFEVNDGYLTALHDRQTALVKLEAAIAAELIGGER